MLKYLILLFIFKIEPSSASLLRTCKDETKVNHVCKVHKDYDITNVPKINGTVPLLIRPIKAEILDIIALNEETQTITINMFFQIMWKDEGLSMSNGTTEK